MKAAPRLEVDLDKIYDNAHTLVTRLARQGISVTGVTKAALGCPEITATLLRAGVTALGDSRIENIESMRLGQPTVPMTLIRSPMLSQVDRVVRHANVSFNTEMEVIRRLSYAAQQAGCRHGVLLMVELGDLREGIMPDDLLDSVRETLSLPNIDFKGIGTNLACRSGVSPDAVNMAALSELADLIETTYDVEVEIVSGGSSANLPWALSGAKAGRINNLRLGEAIFLGCEPLNREPLDGLHSDAITLVAEVIEAKRKPTLPSGQIAQTAFGEAPPVKDRGQVAQVLLAMGRQDTDPEGLRAPAGIQVMGASSDHLILESASGDLSVGTEVSFQLNYSALLRSMTSPFVFKSVNPEKRDRGKKGSLIPFSQLGPVGR